MASELQRVAQGLVDTLNEVPGVVAHLQRTAARCRENAALVMQLVGSRGSMAAQQLDAAACACDAAAHYLSMAPPKALGWAQGLVGGTQGASGSPVSGSADRNPLTPDVRPSTGAGRSPESQSPDAPEEPAPFIEEIFRRLPERPNSEGPTRGVLTRADGRGQIHLVSGTKGPGGQGPGLSGWLARLAVARDHVEGHAAALMRRAGAPREATLYLNNKPCGLDDKDQPLGCDGTLKYQLPPGSKLTVYWPGGHKIYIGEEGEPE